MTGNTSSPLADRVPAGSADARARLEAYYTRYYRDQLAIPGWRDHVALRVADQRQESQRLDRLERALGRSVRGLRLLNVGCGTGGFNRAAEQAGAITRGADPDVEAVAIARARVPTGRLLCAQAEWLPFPEGSFDIVYCFSTLEHVADARRALGEMVRVLRPEGALYLHTPSRWSCFEGHYKVFWIPGLPRWLARAYLAVRGRPTAFLGTLRPLTLAECRSFVEAAGALVTRVLDGDANRPVGGALWPIVRLYYRLLGVRPYVELVAVRRTNA